MSQQQMGNRMFLEIDKRKKGQLQQILLVPSIHATCFDNTGHPQALHI